MIYGQVKNGIIENTIVLDDSNLINLFSNNLFTGEPYDYVIQLCNHIPQPGIGWSYDGSNFIAPPNDDEGI